MIVTTAFGTKVKCGISRNMLAQDKDGNDVRLALVVIEHENGFKQRLAIREDKIAAEGEQIIPREVAIEAAKGGLEIGAATTTTFGR